MSGKAYNFEMKLEAKEMELKERLELLDHDWICKYEGMCEEYEQKIENAEQERDYYKNRMQDEDDELKKIAGQKNILEMDNHKMKGILE